MSQLGSVADLPVDYYDGLVAKNTLPLWPALRSVPHLAPLAELCLEAQPVPV